MTEDVTVYFVVTDFSSYDSVNGTYDIVRYGKCASSTKNDQPETGEEVYEITLAELDDVVEITKLNDEGGVYTYVPLFGESNTPRIDQAQRVNSDYAAELAGEARNKRSVFLEDCDWTQLTDVALKATCVADFATYRQLLRDVPQQGGFPTAISWPSRPPEVND